MNTTNTNRGPSETRPLEWPLSPENRHQMLAMIGDLEKKVKTDRQARRIARIQARLGRAKPIG